MKNQANILIVDDEEVVRRSHLRSLAATGANTRVAEDGKTALSLMEQQASDVVLLDLRMPDIDGMDVLETIKNRWPESEVVIITGYPCIESVKRAVKLAHSTIWPSR